MSYIGTGVTPSPLLNSQLPDPISDKVLSNCNAVSLIITATTNANATFATSSLPLVPEGYITISINGTNKKIPYYGV